MKKRIITFLGTGLITLVILGAGCSSRGNNSQPGATSTGNSTTTDSGKVMTVSAGMRNFGFQPDTITVKAGSTVIWTNHDSVAHTVTADDGSFDSGSVGENKTYSRVFNTPGTYSYHCKPHPFMKAKVIVK